MKPDHPNQQKEGQNHSPAPIANSNSVQSTTSKEQMKSEIYRLNLEVETLKGQIVGHLDLISSRLNAFEKSYLKPEATITNGSSSKADIHANEHRKAVKQFVARDSPLR